MHQMGLAGAASVPGRIVQSHEQFIYLYNIKVVSVFVHYCIANIIAVSY